MGQAVRTAEMRPPIGWLWVAIALEIAGELVDLRWHATHDVQRAFESWGNQAQAHWLLWIATVVTIAVAFLGGRVAVSRVRTGYEIVLASALFYAAVSIWHGWAHSIGDDPSLAHVLLVVTKAGVLVGAIWATVAWKKTAQGPTT